jgi:hypothetical protein
MVMRWKMICEDRLELDVDELEDWVALNDVVLIRVCLMASPKG